MGSPNCRSISSQTRAGSRGTKRRVARVAADRGLGAGGSPAVVHSKGAQRRGRRIPGFRAAAPAAVGHDADDGHDDVKGIALARMVLDIPSIQVDWPL